MTRTKKWDELSRTRCPGTRWLSKSWTSGPPAPPARTYPPFKFTWLIILQYLILLGSKNLHIDQWASRHFQKNETVFCVLARKFLEPLKWFTFVRRVGGKLSRLVYLTPRLGIGSKVSSVNSYCTIIMEYLVVRDINIISVNWYVYIQHQFGYPCPRGGRQAVQASLSCPPPRIWVEQCHQFNLNAP